jgi:hypothetical protein
MKWSDFKFKFIINKTSKSPNELIKRRLAPRPRLEALGQIIPGAAALSIFPPHVDPQFLQH